jgi:hypothetical protein
VRQERSRVDREDTVEKHGGEEEHRQGWRGEDRRGDREAGKNKVKDKERQEGRRGEPGEKKGNRGRKEGNTGGETGR